MPRLWELTDGLALKKTMFEIAVCLSAGAMLCAFFESQRFPTSLHKALVRREDPEKNMFIVYITAAAVTGKHPPPQQGERAAQSLQPWLGEGSFEASFCLKHDPRLGSIPAGS